MIHILKKYGFCIVFLFLFTSIIGIGYYESIFIRSKQIISNELYVQSHNIKEQLRMAIVKQNEFNNIFFHKDIHQINEIMELVIKKTDI